MLPRFYFHRDYHNGAERFTVNGGKELTAEQASALLQRPLTQLLAEKASMWVDENLPAVYLAKTGVLHALSFMIEQQLYHNQCAAQIGSLDTGDEQKLKGYISTFDTVRRLPGSTLFANAKFFGSQVIEDCHVAVAAALKLKYGCDSKLLRGRVVLCLATTPILYAVVPYPSPQKRAGIKSVHFTKSGKAVIIARHPAQKERIVALPR